MNRLTARFDLSYPAFQLHAQVDVPAVGVLALFGPSGSGKTTLVRCLAGLERAPNGFMKLGDDVWQDESRCLYRPLHQRRIGYVFQDARLFPHLSVRGNLAYGMKRTPSQERKVSWEQVIDILGIEYLLERRPHKLSGGEQQRIAIGRALLTSPRLLLLDEPLSSLDAERKREVLPFIQRLYKELKIPIIYVSHSINEILQLAQQVALLQNGSIAAIGPINEVFSRLDLHESIERRHIGAVIDVEVAEHEPSFGLTRVAFKHHSLYIPLQTRGTGDPLRIHILSSDVTLVRCMASLATSALNMLDAVVVETKEADQTTVDVLLDVGCPLVATVTKKSLLNLDIQPGQRLCAHIKSVALIEDLTD
ncbi:Molybdate ABC transporter, ATP-binding protein [Nitrospira sp. KM1]|uniref:molybdenum ABC transporter ATP-binding protein n=1 Tax=Nitrospira sp. KM1 TaxID=1936990 RepID=UPI0013A72822|nr:molybdenum ABC transporter ATP-binding protein [Nitrospira sp. KM1]BCA57096.1 Molybdate ABC transporter, ATP-binding protein [Nitrospira sp. KM1]